MNGRVYDPQIGRFLSADPFVQAPENSQSYNRYSYVWNNPLSAIDPSGYFCIGFCDVNIPFTDISLGFELDSVNFDSGFQVPNAVLNGFVGNEPNTQRYIGADPLGQFKYDIRAEELNSFYEIGSDLGDIALEQISISNIVDSYVEEGFTSAILAIGRKNPVLNIADRVNDNLQVKEYDIVPFRPTNTPLANHHGVNDVWAKNNIPDYKSRAADNPTMALSQDNHRAAHDVTRQWLKENYGKPVGAKVDWTKVSPREIFNLSERQFDAAGVPQTARDAYYRGLNQYIYDK